MKHILKQLQRHVRANEHGWLQLFTIFLTGAVIVWFLGPHVSLAGTIFLKSAKHRLLTILAVSALCLAKWMHTERNAQQKQAALPAALDKKLKTLEGQLRGAIQFLSKPFITAQGATQQLQHLPWYLLIGPTGGGKTTLLANSNINFILKKQIKPEDLKNITSTDSCNWWVTPENVLVDVPGQYVNLAAQHTSPPSLVWPHFLDMLKKFRPDNTLNGILVALPLSDLINPEARTQLVTHLQQRISELRAKFGNSLPFYFTITKCDLLPGFAEFFGDSGSDELSQAWGITFPANSEEAPLATIFAQRFNALIKRLNKQLIWRLHQERGLLERVHVKDFPLHVERLKDILISILNTFMAADANFNLQGMYLTSAIQPPMSATHKIHPQHTTNESQQTLQIMHAPVMPSRSYFIRQLLLQSILNNYGRSPEVRKERRLVYGICAAGILFTLLFSSYDVIHTKQQILAMQDSVVVPTFNIVMPEIKPEEQKVSDTVTVIG